MNHNLKKEINDFYWNELEEQSNGYGSPYPLRKIKEVFGVNITWEELHQIFLENDYRL